jgi:hypothetical protein
LEDMLGRLLFGLNFFYPLLFISVVVFAVAVFIRSWLWMLISFLFLLPNALYLAYFPLPLKLALFIPFLQFILVVKFYLMKTRREKDAR